MKTIATESAPRAIGPYSQAIAVGGFLFVSGQIPLDPGTGELVSGGIESAVERVFDNLEAVLRGAGATLADVVRAGVFLVDMADFAKMNEAYAARFGSHRPARTTVAVAALPAGARVEIDFVVRVG